jgi:hypothetical protein
VKGQRASPGPAGVGKRPGWAAPRRLVDEWTALVLPSALARARSFYEGKLGLTSKGTNGQGNVVDDCRGSLIALFQRAEPTKAEHAALSWEVDDIGAVVKGLRAKGVIFEEYNLPDFKTVDSMCVLGAEKAACFRRSSPVAPQGAPASEQQRGMYLD